MPKNILFWNRKYEGVGMGNLKIWTGRQEFELEKLSYILITCPLHCNGTYHQWFSNDVCARTNRREVSHGDVDNQWLISAAEVRLVELLKFSSIRLVLLENLGNSQGLLKSMKQQLTAWWFSEFLYESNWKWWRSFLIETIIEHFIEYLYRYL